MYEYRAKYLKNYDGDTIDFEIDLGFDVSFNIRTRIFGIDTPEIKGGDEESRELARKARDFVEHELSTADTVIVMTVKDKKGKFGRYLADVRYIKGDQTFTLTKALLKEGYAVERDYG